MISIALNLFRDFSQRGQWQPTPVLLPGKSYGRRSLVGCSPWGHKESGTTDFTFTFHCHALEKEMATHSSILAWSIPGTEEPGGLLSMGLHRVGHDWYDLAAALELSTELVKTQIARPPCLVFLNSQIWDWNKRICILNKFPGNSIGAGKDHILRTSDLYKALNIISELVFLRFIITWSWF